MPLQKPKSRPGPTLSLLALLVLSVTGCGTTSPPIVQPSPVLPQPQSPLMLKPSQSYSSNARANISKWRQQLTLTPLTPTPYSPLGKPLPQNE